MSDWRIRHKDADGHDAQATLLCREAAIVQALFLERRQHCRVQIIEGPDGGRRQSNGIHRRTGRHARSEATPYAASARHSANAIERLCL